ncbi:hypothetical protein GCM10011309_02030 [Litorimonas cladophorae]|uniref:HYR domain-containing protein n=1 Tax=Litorimonas cladophorae TaxID=1220491 RepID=A0A918KB92_9PROT|nr:hypothetical protein [Litorimonas cladophorae]GGX56765.1 hypothetical protein GCM10011309_02030 [Litorimonas cladophorae]
MTYLKKSPLSALSIASALLLSACGGGGGGGSVNPPVVPPAADTTAPAVAFSVSTLTVESTQTGSSTLTATDAVGVTTGPTVSCTNGGSFNISTNIFTAAAVTTDTTSVCTATASDAAGNTGTATLTVTMTAPVDTTPPTVEFSPTTLTVESEMTETSILTATDAFGVTSGPTVTCTNGGSFDVGSNIFTAAAVTTTTTSVCTATASDAAGNTGTGTLTVTMTPPPAPDNTAPVVTFSPVTLTVESDMTGTSTLTASDNVGVTTGPTVTCTNGGSFDVPTNVFTAATVTVDTTSVCTATAGDAAGNTGTATLTVTMKPAAAPPATVSIALTGKLTYDRVPLNTATNGLNYGATFQQPIRQAPVELVDAAGTVLQSTVSDDNGDYSFTVDSGLDVRVRVKSEVQKTGANLIDLQVVDNTSGNAVYALQGAVIETPRTDQTRDLNAGSGWGGTSYTGTRAAAPFALLDTVFAAIEDFIVVDSDVDFPAFDVMWSTRNRSESGNVADGQIGTSSFTVSNGVPVIRILGDDGVDTDEYDVHVVVHEFGHYFENSLSRSDSIGGSHSSNDRLDARVAFGEGFGNALSGMILDDSFYRDSFGTSQSRGFSINVESNTFASAGWYSEGSVQSILYDLYDSVDDGADSASYGLAPIYGAFTDPDYKDTQAFTSIFAFLEALENQPNVVAADVTALLAAQSISGSGGFGVGETNNGGLSDALPVYLNLPTDDTEVGFCSVDNFGTYNKHGNRRYFEFTTPAAGRYRFSLARDTGATTSDPDFLVYKDGVLIARGESGTTNVENQLLNLTAGQHVLEAYSFENVGAGQTPADVCYTLKMEAQ